ncbi:hypothetical protein MNBD_GAMMA13-1217 [hydrothermal vent metagenome]|uniref:Lipoprotein n=1 Tax=hydrothermal vent metagenome TaxID=652676 RepID=A0A3B0Z1D3_9ZZZZ
MKLSRAFFTVLAILLAGCQSVGSRTGLYSSPLQPGDEVIMLKALTIPSSMARVYMQAGKTMSYGESNQYEPFCYFLLRDPLPAEQVIKPGIFVIHSTWLDEVTISVEYPVRVAALFPVGGRSPIAYQFHFKLKAADQQNITLVCSGAFDDPLSAAPIRLPEVRRVLDGYAEVKVKTLVPPASR